MTERDAAQILDYLKNDIRKSQKYEKVQKINERINHEKTRND